MINSVLNLSIGVATTALMIGQVPATFNTVKIVYIKTIELFSEEQKFNEIEELKRKINHHMNDMSLIKIYLVASTAYLINWGSIPPNLSTYFLVNWTAFVANGLISTTAQP